MYKACWAYTSQYQCLKPNAVNYCAALESDSSCVQTSTKCGQTAFDGSCMKETKTYRCDDPNHPTPTNTVVLDKTYTVSDGGLDTSQCNAESTDSNCHLASHSCVEGPETRTISGMPVYKDCWKYQDDYSCINPTPKDTCADLAANPTCTKVGETCNETDPTLGCTDKDIQYSCLTQAGTTSTVQDCSTKTTCVGDTCWETGSPADSDFANAVIANEVGREAATYQDANGQLFTGVAESCREGWGGLKSCCKDSPGAKTNNDVLQQVGFTAAKAVGKYAYNVGSKYMYDYMYQVKDWITSGSSIATSSAASEGAGAAAGGAADFNVEFYGFGWTSGAASDGAFALGDGFYFDPTSFAIAVAIQIIMELMSCEPAEQQLGMHKQQGLTHYIGSHCTKKELGVCVENSQVFCSYNSKLAKLIQEGGRPQIGKSWGTAAAPDCSGFTVAEFGKIDFSQVDLSSFTSDVMKAAVIPDPTQLSNIISNEVSGKTTNDPNDATAKMPFGTAKTPGG